MKNSFFVLFFITQTAFASAATVPQNVVRHEIIEALKQHKPAKELWSSLHARHGAKAIEGLIAIANNEQERDELRWASLFGIARMTGKQGLKVIGKFTTNRSWLMRDASLKVFAALDAKEMAPQIETALKDPALVVRTTAVDVIGHLKLHASAPKLIEALFDPLNYRREKPLWIHNHILATLRELRYTEASQKLVELLEAKKDHDLRGQIVATLESLTGKNFSGKSLDEQVYLWKRNTLSEKTF